MHHWCTSKLEKSRKCRSGRLATFPRALCMWRMRRCANGAPAEAAPCLTSRRRPPWRKRYGWYRLYDGFWRHPKWKVAARLAGGIHVTAAICVVGTLLECANKGKPRGCVEDYSFEEAAASLDLETQDVERIYGALEGMGWIDRAFLVTWDERQPDNEDPTAADANGADACAQETRAATAA